MVYIWHSIRVSTDQRFECQLDIRDMFNVYLNKFEFRFLRLHVNKTNKFCFFMLNGRVFGIAK